MAVFAIVQARMTSSRLPGKILMEVMGRSLLEYELERVARARRVDRVIVATTENAGDDAVAALCGRLGVDVFRGSEDDVLARYWGAATAHGAREGDAIVRLTADCPLLDPGVADAMLDAYDEAARGGRPLDYLGIDHETLPHGTDVEIFPFTALAAAHLDGHDALDREHVTWYLWHNPERFRVARWSYPERWGAYRITVDAPEDFEVVRAALEALYPVNKEFTLADVVSFLDAHEDIKRLNADVQQRHYASATSNW